MDTKNQTNRLTLIKLTGFNKRRSRLGLFKCSCTSGTIKECIVSEIKSNKIRSCGCLKKEVSKQTGKNNITHNMSKDITYVSWQSMIQRCTNVNHDYYHKYSNRGICQLWEYSFEEFYRDMGPRPSKKHSIDRIDNDNGYYPKNCRWVTQNEQENNKSTNRRLEFNGLNLTMSQWAKRLGVSRNFIFERLKRGYSIEEALTVPKNKGLLFEYNGVVKNISEWAKEYNINRYTLTDRIHKHGWDIEKALKTPIKNNGRKNDSDR